jgi:hypothetical protein
VMKFNSELNNVARLLASNNYRPIQIALYSVKHSNKSKELEINFTDLNCMYISDI